MFLLNMLLALMWTTLTGQFTLVNLLAGFLIGYGVLWLFYPWATGSYLRKPWLLVGFIIFFLKELIVASFRVAIHVLTPHHSLRPAIVAVPLSVQSDLEIALLGSLISLTPGTLSLDVSQDRRVLYVHAIEMEDIDEFRASIKNGFERRIQEVFSS
jgi:multicomponent Na+:H+ antiporter subunit E